MKARKVEEEEERKSRMRRRRRRKVDEAIHPGQTPTSTTPTSTSPPIPPDVHCAGTSPPSSPLQPEYRDWHKISARIFIFTHFPKGIL